MKKIFALLIFICFFGFSLVSCHCRKKTPREAAVTEVKRDFEKEGYTKATVVYFELDGCTYLLQLADGNKLEPTNMAAEFKKDKLDVWIKYTVDTQAASICMAGQLVKLSDIQLRK